MPSGKEASAADRPMLIVVSAVAASVIALEILTFQTLCYVNEYLPATRVISVALMGIALGGLASFFVGRDESGRFTAAASVALPVTVLGSFPTAIWLSPHPILMMALLSVPYAVGSSIIATAFNRSLPGRVYLYDLVGAGIGALLVVAIVPLLREEGGYFALVAISSIPAVLVGWARRRAGGGIAPLAGGVAAALVGCGLLVSHLVADPFNIARIATADAEEFPGKIFNFPKGRYNLVYSRGSLVERIDIIKRDPKKTPAGRFAMYSCYSGRIVDAITSSVQKNKGSLDTRMPTRLKLGQDPETLLVGPSGQGLCKAVQTLGRGRIDAVEINGAIAGLMIDELWKASGRAYERMNLTVGDVRTFLARTDRKYDFITLLNTHTIWSIGHQGPPEYTHTVEAMREYLEHLKPDGFVLFEERNVNEQADLGVRRMVHTAVSVLGDMGSERPEDHIGIWELYHHCRKRDWDRGRCKRRKRFTFLMVKATPMTAEEEDHLVAWADMLGSREPNKAGHYRGIEWKYLPSHRRDNYWTETILEDDIYDVSGVDRSLHDLSPVTDDRPFSFDVFSDRAPQKEALRDTALLSIAMVLLPSIAAFVARRGGFGNERVAASGRAAATAVGLVLYFSMLGVGYILLEVVFIQKFAIFLSSPVHAFVAVLATMLVSSGLGGHVAGRIGRGHALAALAAVVVLAMASYLWLGSLLDVLMPLPFALRAAASVAMVAPIGFAMGMPFPYGVALTKEALSDVHAGLFFGINGAVAAVGTPLSILTSMTMGFGVTILLGGGAYLCCLAILALLGRGSARRRAPGETGA